MIRIRVVAGAIIHKGHLLAAQRGKTMSQAGFWELPGGKVKQGESDEEALARELREELDISVDVAEGLGSNVHTYTDQIIELVGYRCRLTCGLPKAMEHAQLRWVSIDDLDDLTWAPADVPLLAAVAVCMRK